MKENRKRTKSPPEISVQENSFVHYINSRKFCPLLTILQHPSRGGGVTRWKEVSGPQDKSKRRRSSDEIIAHALGVKRLSCVGLTQFHPLLLHQHPPTHIKDTATIYPQHPNQRPFGHTSSSLFSSVSMACQVDSTARVYNMSSGN